MTVACGWMGGSEVKGLGYGRDWVFLRNGEGKDEERKDENGSEKRRRKRENKEEGEI